jgi:tetratricopeptide (TPR) repeat protein
MLFGDLAEAAGKPEAAQNAYRTVGKMAPWPNYRARAAVALGRSYLMQNKTAEASASFKLALNTPDTAPGVQQYKLAASLGEARCLAAAGQQETALDMIDKVIAQADSEDHELLAEAYNARGAAYRANKQPKDALLAYLTVHLVYFNSPQNHIEALQNLVELWNEVQKPERSAEAARILRDRYKRAPR